MVREFVVTTTLASITKEMLVIEEATAHPFVEAAAEAIVEAASVAMTAVDQHVE